VSSAAIRGTSATWPWLLAANTAMLPAAVPLRSLPILSGASTAVCAFTFQGGRAQPRYDSAVPISENFRVQRT
jgi:hypothetical protein